MGADDLINSGPPMGDGGDTDTPYLGVPKGYTAQRSYEVRPSRIAAGESRVQHVTRTVTPLYYKGDEYTPSSLAAEDRARVQLALREAGLFTKNERFQLGVWDENTRNAYKRLLEYANGAGLDWKDALADYANAKATMGDTAGADARAPLSIKVSNPADIRKAADAAARGAIGRRLRPDELNKLVSAYQSLETQEQTKAYDVSNTGGTMTAAPDPGVFLEDQAKALDPQGADEMQNIGLSNDFFDLLDVSNG